MKTNRILPGLALLFFCACSEENGRFGREDIEPQTQAVMQVEVTENNAQGADRINTLRFIVFTDLASMPKVEKNEFYGREDFVFEQPLGQTAVSKAQITLEVARKVSGANEKLIIAIANEPPLMKEALKAILTPGDLANLELEMEYFVCEDHLSLQTDVMTPMSGAAWTDNSHIYPTEEEAGNHRVELSLQRAVARVDVYMNTDLPDGMKITAGSYATLDSTYTKSYYVRHEDGNGHVFGKIFTAAKDDLDKKSWKAAEEVDVPYKTPSDPDIPSSVHLCTFYTPERNYVFGKLRLDVGVGIDGNDGMKSGGITLEMNDGTNLVYPSGIIRRNTVYKVTVTVGVNGITGIVQDWNGEDITAEL